MKKEKKLADRASNLLVHFSRLEGYEREAPFWKYSNPSPKQRRLDEDNTEGTEAFHPDLHPSHQKVHSSPLAVTGKKPRPGATPALHPAPSSSVPTSLHQLGGPPFLWKKKVYSYQVHPHPSSIHPNSTCPSRSHSKSQPDCTLETSIHKNDHVDHASGVGVGAAMLHHLSVKCLSSTSQHISSTSLLSKSVRVSHSPQGL